MAVPPAFGQKLAEAVHVDPYLAQVQVHALAVDLQPTLRASPAERREGSAQGGAGAGLVVFGPEQPRQRVACVAPAGDGQVGDERDGFSRVYLDRLAAV